MDSKRPIHFITTNLDNRDKDNSLNIATSKLENLSLNESEPSIKENAIHTPPNKRKTFQIISFVKPKFKKMSMDVGDIFTNKITQNLMNMTKRDPYNNLGAPKKFTGCNCKNSTCLKRYCECFNRMKFCSSICKCINCLNKKESDKEKIDGLHNNFLIKTPVAFRKIDMDSFKIFCNCKKSNCLKKYCECFQNGFKCNINCKCEDCKNKFSYQKKLFGEGGEENKQEFLDLFGNKNQLGTDKFDLNMNTNLSLFGTKNLDGNEEAQGSSMMKKRNRFFSYDISDEFKWNSLNLKKIDIDNNKVIIKNYRINDNTTGNNNYNPFGKNISEGDNLGINNDKKSAFKPINLIDCSTIQNK